MEIQKVDSPAMNFYNLFVQYMSNPHKKSKTTQEIYNFLGQIDEVIKLGFIKGGENID